MDNADHEVHGGRQVAWIVNLDAANARRNDDSLIWAVVSAGAPSADALTLQPSPRRSAETNIERNRERPTRARRGQTRKRHAHVAGGQDGK